MRKWKSGAGSFVQRVREALVTCNRMTTQNWHNGSQEFQRKRILMSQCEAHVFLSVKPDIGPPPLRPWEEQLNEWERQLTKDVTQLELMVEKLLMLEEMLFFIMMAARQ